MSVSVSTVVDTFSTAVIRVCTHARRHRFMTSNTTLMLFLLSTPSSSYQTSCATQPITSVHFFTTDTFNMTIIFLILLFKEEAERTVYCILVLSLVFWRAPPVTEVQTLYVLKRKYNKYKPRDFKENCRKYLWKVYDCLDCTSNQTLTRIIYGTAYI